MSKEIELWNAVAEKYSSMIDKGDPMRINLLDDSLLSLLGDVSGKMILDAGCGEGYLSRTLFSLGASVVGVDGSDALVDIAKKKGSDRDGLKFSSCDLKEDLPFDDGSFDTVVCNMALMDFDPIEKAVAEFSRTLRRNGVFVFSILHTFTTAGKLGKTIKEKLLRRLPHYKIYDYKMPRTMRWRLGQLSKKTLVYHRPLESYFDTLRRSGFLAQDVREPVFDNKEVGGGNYIKLCAKVPPFLLVRAIKV